MTVVAVVNPVLIDDQAMILGMAIEEFDRGVGESLGDRIIRQFVSRWESF